MKNKFSIDIDNLDEVVEKVEQENKLKKQDPSLLLDGEIGVSFLNGEPQILIGDKYVPEKEALIILQERVVVREYLKLLTLKKTK